MHLFNAATIITPLIYDHATAAACTAHLHERWCPGCDRVAHLLMDVDTASRRQAREADAALLADVLVFINDVLRFHVEQDTLAAYDLSMRVQTALEAAR